MIDLEQLRLGACAAAQAAAEEALKWYGAPLQVEQKADDTPVTEADIHVSNFLRRTLPEVFPCPVASEEHPLPFHERTNTERYWLVDPLDGTGGFIRQDGEFSINIAFMEQNTPRIGVIAVPVKQLVYSAAQDQGAFKLQDERETRIANARSGPLAAIVDSKSPGPEGLTRSEQFCQGLNVSFSELARVGSAYKLCLLAEGNFDAALRFDRLWEWDTAAAECILNESGCCLFRTDSAKEIAYNRSEDMQLPGFIACRRDLADTLRAALPAMAAI